MVTLTVRFQANSLLEEDEIELVLIDCNVLLSAVDMNTALKVFKKNRLSRKEKMYHVQRNKLESTATSCSTLGYSRTLMTSQSM